MNKIRTIIYTLIFILSYYPISISQNTPGSFADLAEKLMPSVVNISSTQTVVTKSNPFASNGNR